VPIEDGITVIDALDSHVQISSQSVVTVPKLRFQVSCIRFLKISKSIYTWTCITEN
jgi:hypothetical protein